MPKDFQQLDWDLNLEDDLRQLVRLAVREDLDRGYDWTTVALVSAEVQGRAAVVTREPGVIAGLSAVPVVIDEMNARLEFESRTTDGDEVDAGAVVAELTGSARDMFACERPLLNLLGRLSGIATLTNQYVQLCDGTKARIYDTRKTAPGWRRLEKYAVRCGGGHNHRTGLFDAILIKDNHLALSAENDLSPADAVCKAREFLSRLGAEIVPRDMLVEIEVELLDQLEEVLHVGPDLVLLDNMSPEQLQAAVAHRDEFAPQVELEASGGISIETLPRVAAAGVDRISVGALTHSARWLDVGLDWRSPSDR